MYLSNIRLWNFRKFGGDNFDLVTPHLSLDFRSGLNLIVGENDSGKSAIIDAIKLVLKTHSFDSIYPHRDDFYNESTRFRIELQFDGFSVDGVEAAHFVELLSSTGEGDNQKSFLKLSYDVTRNAERILPADVRAGTGEGGHLLSAEARDYLKVTYLKPLRDAQNELVSRRGSRLSRILYGHDAFKNHDEEHHLVSLLFDYSESVEKYFEGIAVAKDHLGNKQYIDLETDQLGKQLKSKIDDYVRAFCDDSIETDLQVFSGDLRGILEKLELTIKSERNLGLGTHNRLFMASELLHLNKESWTGLRLGLIEELEAHLHPQAQMKVVDFLQQQDAIQLIMTSHSPNLTSKVRLDSLALCARGNVFSLRPAETSLEPADYVFLEKFLDVTKANLFFAKGIILVEGWAEEILIPSIARKLGFDLTTHGVSIVNVGNLAFLRYSRIFLRREPPEIPIPVSIVTDSDIQRYKFDGDVLVKREVREVELETNARIADLTDHFDAQRIKCFVAPSWTFENSLCQSESFSALFRNAARNVHSLTDWNADFESELARKLLKKSLKKTEIAYLVAQSIDSLVGPIGVTEGDSAFYLFDAIKHACNK